MGKQREGDMFELADDVEQCAIIKVIGVGGGGGNAVKDMIANHVSGVDFICANTDAQALSQCNTGVLIQLGNGLTKGLGAGANPEVGRQAAQEDRERIADAIRGANMLFITAGMGGGTGTGAAPVVAEVAREQGILTVAVVTKPFAFEGKPRMRHAEEGIKVLAESVDSLIVVPNEKLLPTLGKNIKLNQAFGEVNKVLQNAVQGISELITSPGDINVDFADVKTVMSEMGMAMMGIGVARGENRALEAAEQAVASPLLEDIDLNGARGVLVNVTSNGDLGLGEYYEIGGYIQQYASDEATFVIGNAVDPELGDDIRVVVVATGIGQLATAKKEATADSIRPRKVVDNTQPLSPNDYSKLERPTAARRAEQARDTTQQMDTEYMEIPAFLRRQAD